MSPASAEFGNAFNRSSSSIASTRLLCHSLVGPSMLRKETKLDLTSPNFLGVKTWNRWTKITTPNSSKISDQCTEYIVKCIHCFRYPFQIPSRKVGFPSQPFPFHCSHPSHQASVTWIQRPTLAQVAMAVVMDSEATLGAKNSLDKLPKDFVCQFGRWVDESFLFLMQTNGKSKTVWN